MEITHVRLYRLSGTLEHEGEFWEERLVRPVDIYPEHKAEGATLARTHCAGRLSQRGPLC